jgi:hypothetical protein
MSVTISLPIAFSPGQSLRAIVIAFSKVYLLSGAILLATLPLLLLVRKTKPSGGKAGAVHAE